MSPSNDLTPSAVERIHQGHTNFFPTVQVLDVKKIQNSTGGNDRYRLVVSDGKHYQQAMLATQLNNLVVNGQITQYGLVCLKEFICNEVQSKKVVIILKLDVVQASLGVQLGDPVEYGKAGGGGYNAQNSGSSNQAAPSLNTMQSAPVKQEGGYRPQSSNTPPKPRPAFGGNAPAYNAQPKQYGGAIARQEPGGPVTPIMNLNPYVNKWTIKARVTAKSDIRRWNNAKGEGTLFSVDLLDEHGSEIRGTFFKELVDKFYHMLDTGRVFLFSGGRLKVAQKQYTSLKNEYEITFDNSTTITPCEDEGKIQTAHYNFKQINELEAVDPGAVVDVVGIVKSFAPDTSINTKTGRSTAKRDIVLVDASNTEVRLTVWGDKATQNPEQWEANPVVAIKGVKVSDYNGRSLSTLPSSQMSFQPDIPEAAAIFNWWHQTGSSATTNSISSGGGGAGGGASGTIEGRRYLADVKDHGLGHGEKPDFIEVKGTISFLKSEPEPWYRSCTNGDCKRKVVEEMEGYRCEKCGKNMSTCGYRYVLSVSAGDISGSQYLSCFDEHAQIILGKTAEELYQFKVSDMTAEYDAIFNEATFSQWFFRLRVKSEQVNDEQRIKCTVASIKPVDYTRECKELIKAIGQYN